jgi:hypothetical protein
MKGSKFCPFSNIHLVFTSLIKLQSHLDLVKIIAVPNRVKLSSWDMRPVAL